MTVENELRRHDLKVTEARVKVLQVLHSSTQPLSIGQLQRKLKTVTPVTLYRTVGTLKNAGMLRKAEHQHRHAHYQLATPATSHQLVCTVCERRFAFANCNVKTVARKVLKEAREFSAITDHSLTLFGLCTRCARIN